LNKVAALRATFKKQQERCIEFLQLSEDYANKYLLDIDAEVRQQSALLENLEARLEAAKKLHGDAVDLQMFYESGTVASMNDFCLTGMAVPRCLNTRPQGKLLRRSSGISRPLPQDNALFKEVDFVMAEIRRFYEELNKFWREEICHVVEALKKRRVDPRDFERWNSFRSSLNQTIEFWKVCLLPLLLCIPNRSNTMSRTGHQAATLKPYPAITYPLLQSVYYAFHFAVSLD
jgi:hypothetical protein